METHIGIREHLSRIVNLLKKKIFDAKIFALFFALLMVTYSLSPEWYAWLMGSVMGEWLLWLKQLIEAHLLLNITIIAFFLYVTCLKAIRWHEDADVRWYRPFLIVWGLQLLWMQNPLETPAIYGWFDYRVLWSICLVSLLVVFSIGWFKRRETVNQVSLPSFSLDNQNEECENESMKKYGDDIVNHILGTNLDSQSFAIGITGAWGSGKTTFLKYLRSRLRDETEIVWFNPWMCKTPEQVTEDFFLTLHQKLSHRHSKLSRPIRDYANMINNASLNVGEGLWPKISLSLPQMSLWERKKRLSERFARLNKPVVVLIDDLDRLEADEAFEVLRLIRNTADLSNTFYIVAYDKAYVSEILKCKGIHDAEAYLEKIFPIEVHQPKVEIDLMSQHLYTELSRYPKYGNKLPQKLFSAIGSSGINLTLRILNTYRRINRFSRLLLLNLDYVGSAFSNEFKLTDLFWLELLQTYDKRTYDLLAESKEVLLDTEGSQYSLKPAIKESDKSEDNGCFAETYNGSLKPLSLDILKLLFEERTNVSKFSVRHAENYDKYFALNVSELKLSFHDFQNLFDGKPIEVVQQWLKRGKRFSSILFNFQNMKIPDLSTEKLSCYLYGLLELAYQAVSRNDLIVYKVKDLLRGDKYSTSQYPLAKDYTLSWFHEKLRQDCKLEDLAKELNRLYISIETDENGRKKQAQSLLISNEDVKMLLRDVMKKHLELHRDLSAMSILDEKSDTGRLFGNCCVCIDDNGYNIDDASYENVVFDLVIRHFEKKTGPAKSEMDKAIKSMFKFDVPKGLDLYEEADYYSYAEEGRVFRLNAYFGSDWKKVEEFLNRCSKAQI